MLYCGIDEAGLGPLLGPLIAASCTGNILPDTLGELLTSSGLWPKPVHSGILLADSKQIYRGDFARLEQLALGIYLGSSCQQHAWQAEKLLLQDILPPQISVLDWYRDLWRQPLHLPLVAYRRAVWEQAARWRAVLQRQGGLLQLESILLTEREFNCKIAESNNKSLVLRELIGALLEKFVHSLRSVPAAATLANCTIDRLGGLKYYRPWLCKLFAVDSPSLFPARSAWQIDICGENNSSSEYRVRHKNEDLQFALKFWVRGDQRNILCAIASIWAKYYRELFMWQFNRYWQEKFPGISRTSGYQRDAVIFLAHLQRQMGKLPLHLRRDR